MSAESDTTTARHRRAARLAAVQALYQLDMNRDANVDGLVREYADHRLGKEIEGVLYHAADGTFFADLLKGRTERAEEIDALIVAHMNRNWKFERLEVLMRAILRAGCYEILARPDVPTAVIVNEYVEVAKAFYGDDESGFVNAVLDAAARSARE